MPLIAGKIVDDEDYFFGEDDEEFCYDEILDENEELERTKFNRQLARNKKGNGINISKCKTPSSKNSRRRKNEQ